MTDTTITRLRSANPVPEPPAIDDLELFARITASGGDPRLSSDPALRGDARLRGDHARHGRVGRSSRRLLGAMGVALGAIILAAAPFANTKLTIGSPAPVK